MSTLLPSNIPSKVVSRIQEFNLFGKIGELMGSAKDACNNIQSELSAAIFPSIPGQPAGKYLDLALGIDIHRVIFPWLIPICPVPTCAVVFDIVAGIFGAISDNMDPPKPAEDGTPPPFSWKTIVTMMRPSVKANGQWIANAGTPLLHLPGIVFHAFPTVAPFAEAEMFMGSSKVMADGTPFSTRFHPALSCNKFGFNPPKRLNKPKVKFSKKLPTCMLLFNFSHGNNEVLVGGPPTIDLFGKIMAGVMSLGMKGLGKLWKKAGGDILMGKLKDFLFKKFPFLETIQKKLSAIQKKLDCLSYGEPVDAATGRVIAENQDFFLPGPIPINWTRTYYSDAEILTPLGYNWHHSYHIGYTVLEGGFVLLRMQDGREVVLPPLVNGESFYHRQEKIDWKRDEHGYIYKDSTGFTYRFADHDGNKKTFYPVLSLEDNYEHKIQFFYNHKGLSSILDSSGRTLLINTDHNGIIQSVQLERQGQDRYTLVMYGHDEQGNLTEVINNNGSARKKFYYQEHLLVRLTNQSGMNFYWEYEGKGDNARCIHTWGDEGILEYWTRYEKGKTITTNSLGHTTEYHYDENFLIHTLIDAKGGITRRIYDENKELSVVISPEGNCTKYSYDERGNLIKVLDANENTTSLKYNSQNQIENYRTASGSSFRWMYDELGRLKKRIYPDGSSLNYTYENNQLTTLEDNAGRKTQLIWDTQHNLTEAIFPNGNRTQWHYDFMGRLVQEILPNNATVRYQYDEAGNLTELVEADGNHHYFDYNAAGDIVKARDNNQEVAFEYWGLGLLKSRAQNGKKIEFTYDTEEQLKSIRNEIGEAYRFTRNPLGEIVGEWGFDGLQRQYFRDADGRITAVNRPEERWTKYHYDGVGNLIIAEHSDGSRECFTYNPDGLLVEAANENSTVIFQRDASGRIIQETQNGYQVKSQYNADGQRVQLTSSLGAAIEQTYDKFGFLQQLNTAEGWQATFERDNLGLELSRSLTGGVSSQLERDAKGRVTRQQIQGRNVEGSKKQYVWGAGDRLLKIINEHSGQHTDFSYDTAGNLLSADYGGITQIYKMPDAIGNLFKTPERSDRQYAAGGKLIKDEKWHYAYDREGNLRLKSKHAISTLKAVDTTKANTASYNKISFLHDDTSKKETTGNGFWIDERKPQTDYSNPFDQKAEVRRYTQAELAEYDRLRKKETVTPEDELQWQPGDWEYTWQGNGMLKAVRNPQGQWIRFEYDALGRRTAKIVGNTTIFRYIWDGNVLLHEWQYQLKDRPRLEVTPKGELVYSNAEPAEDVTTWVYEEGSFTPSAKIRNGKQYSIISDYLGTPYQVYDEQGELIWQVELDIYGKVKEDKFGNLYSIPFRYQGQYYDKEIELAYNRFRYYDCHSGNYISQDPIGLAGNNPNLYGYVKDTNVWIDSFGLNPLSLPAPIGSNPWMPGEIIESIVVPKGGMIVEMAMAPGQINPGGWGTLDHITDVSYVRNQLAVTPEFKPEISHVQQFYIPEGTRVQMGMVGPQTLDGVTYQGGGNQVQILNYEDRAKLKPIGEPRKITCP